MKRLRLCFLLPLSIFCSQITAQVEDLMRDKNITWIAESYNDLFTEQIIEEKIGKWLNKLTPLKFSNLTEEYVPDGYALQHFILEAAKASKLNIYNDVDCKNRINYDDICRFDTIFEGSKLKVERHEPSAEDHPFFRARQVVFYDSSKVQFGLKTLAVALMYKYTNEDNQPAGWRPAFWIKASDSNKKPKLSNVSITWAKSIRHEISLRADSIKFLKEKKYWVLMDTLLQAVVNKHNIPFYEAEGKKLNMIERAKLYSRSDTISVIDPITLKIEKEIVNSILNVDDLFNFRIVQNWYWDDKNKQLKIWLWETGPLKDVKNEAGEFLFRLPLFYRRTDD
jgi:hypothetical protein